METDIKEESPPAHTAAQAYQWEGNTDNDVYIVDKILKRRKFPGGVTKYLVKWVGFSNKETTWEPQEHFEQSFHLVVEYERRLKEKKKGGKLSARNRLLKQTKKPKVTSKQSFSFTISPAIFNKRISHPDVSGIQKDALKTTTSPCTGKTSDSNISQDECPPLPEKILGLTYSPSGELLFVVKWGPGEGSVVKAKDAKVRWPQVVISFYEEKYVRQYFSVNYSDGFEDIEDTMNQKTRLLLLQQKSKELKAS